MRHNVYGRKLGRDKNERTALFRNLVQSLFLEEKIVTTQAKAKAIKPTVDKLINQAKLPTTRRLVNQFVTQKKTQEKLVKELIPRLKGRNSGYTSMVKLGHRIGDDAAMVQMSLILDEAARLPKTAKVAQDKPAANAKKPETASVQPRTASKKENK